MRALALVVGLACLCGTAEARTRAATSREPPSKKAKLLADKRRHHVRQSRPPRVGAPPVVPVCLENRWTHETLAVDPKRPPSAAVVDDFLRCHFTNQHTTMDRRLVPVLLKAAARFHSAVIEIVSGYRAPKYNLFLRKKGHEVARDSQHTLGHAVDFRVPGVGTTTLLKWAKSLRLGGVGYYPESAFVHCDVGPIRYWQGH